MISLNNLAGGGDAPFVAFNQPTNHTWYHIKPVAPVAYQVIVEPGIGQFREFESPRVHTRINSWGLFLVHNFSRGKRESVS